MLLAFLYQLAALAGFCWCTGVIIINGYHLIANNQWKGYSKEGIKLVVAKFALSPPAVKITLGNIEQPYGSFAPVLGMYNPDTCVITIDTRIVRTERMLVKTLLHELCHHNQMVGNRIYEGMGGLYIFRPIEREARTFASAWGFLARRIYRSK